MFLPDPLGRNSSSFPGGRPNNRGSSQSPLEPDPCLQEQDSHDKWKAQWSTAPLTCSGQSRSKLLLIEGAEPQEALNPQMGTRNIFSIGKRCYNLTHTVMSTIAHVPDKCHTSGPAGLCLICHLLAHEQMPKVSENSMEKDFYI